MAIASAHLRTTKLGSHRGLRPVLLAAAIAIALNPWAGAATINVPADQATIQDAVNIALPGDEIVLADGAYDESVDLNQMGSELDAPAIGDLTIRAANNLQVSINGGFAAAITASSFDGDITIIGLVLTATSGIAGGVVDLLGVDGVVTLIGNEWPAGFGGDGVRVTTLGNMTTAIEVRNNTFTAPADNRDAISLFPGGNHTLDFTAINNTFTQLMDDGIKVDVQGPGSVIVLGRIFDNQFSLPVGSGSPIDLDFGNGMSNGGVSSIAIENNSLMGTVSGPAIRVDIEGENTIANLIIRNNTIVNPDGEAILIDSGSTAMEAIGNLLIDGNNITGTSANAAIKARGQGTDDQDDGFWNLVLTNNTINWSAGDGIVFDASSMNQYFLFYLELSDNDVIGTPGGSSAYVFDQLLADVFLEMGLSSSYVIETVLLDNNNSGSPVSVTGTVIPGPNAVQDGWVPANIGDFVWEDTNEDGLQDQDEDGVQGVPFDLTGTLSVVPWDMAFSTTSDSTGNYLFPAMLPAVYTITVTPPEASDGLTLLQEGSDPTVDSDFDPTTGEASVTFTVDDLDIDAGLLPFTLVTISGAVFEDVSADGVADSDPALVGVGLERWRDGGDGEVDFGIDGDDTLSAVAISGATGTYQFTDVGSGLHFVRPQIPVGAFQTTAPAIATVMTSSGTDVTGLIFGLAYLGSIHGIKFEDLNENGVWDQGSESGLAGVTFTLTGTDGPGNIYNMTTTTGADGSFAYSGLAPSVTGAGAATGFTVTETVPAGSIATTPVTFAGNLQSRQELVAIAGQAGLPPGDPRIEVLIGAGLQFGNVQVVDIALSKTESIDPAVAGSGPGNLTYVVTATNLGPRVATGVTIAESLTLPTGVTVDSITPGAGTTYSDPTWTIGSLANGASATLTVTLTVSATTLPGTDVISNTATVTAVNEPEIETSNNTATESTSVIAQVDIELSKTESIDPVVAGSGAGNLVYVVTATNNGPSDATGLTVSEALTLPAGVTVDSVVPSGTTTYSDPTWTVGALASGASETLTITLTVDAASAPGTDVISDTATVTEVNGVDTDAGNDSATESTSIVGEVDLSITKTESADPVVAGSGAGNLTYVVTATNNGPSDASGVSISEILTLPAGVTVESVTPTSGTWSEPTWTVGTIASNASESLTVVLTVASSVAAGTDVIADTATVTAVDGTETNPGDDSATESTSVTREVDLFLEKTGPSTSLAPGETLVYTLQVTNFGPSDASAVTVTDTLPAGVTFVSSTGCSEDPAGLPTCTLGTIPSGASAQYTISVTVDPDPPPIITNSATASSDEPDSDPTDNTDEASTVTDNIPPTVGAMSVPGLNGYPLTECTTALTRIQNLSISFSEPMFDPAGDDDADDVTNPTNYRVLAAGPDGDFATLVCGPEVGDDETVAISRVSYDESSMTALLTTMALPSSQIRVMVCGSTSVQDIAGNPLDGTGDGFGGDDYILTFRSDPSNLFSNGHFDCASTGFDHWLVWDRELDYSENDVDDSSISGSAEIFPLLNNSFQGLGQCVNLETVADHELTSRLRVQGTGDTIFWRGCEFFTGDLCGERGTGFSNLYLRDLLTDSSGSWYLDTIAIPIPLGAQSARCGLILGYYGLSPFTAWVDDMWFGTEGPIFEDGFDSGDTSGWTVVQP